MSFDLATRVGSCPLSCQGCVVPGQTQGQGEGAQLTVGEADPGGDEDVEQGEIEGLSNVPILVLKL